MDSGRQKYLEECHAFVDEFRINNKLLIAYLRKKDNAKKGVVVAFREGDKIKVGASLCNPRDTFDKYVGIEKAINHARTLPLDKFQNKVDALLLAKQESINARENEKLFALVKEYESQLATEIKQDPEKEFPHSLAGIVARVIGQANSYFRA